MKASELDRRMYEGEPVTITSQRWGMPVCFIVRRTPHLVTLVSTGNVRGVSSWMLKLSNISRLKPQELTERFLPPGAILTVKTHDVMPCSDTGMTPAEMLFDLAKQAKNTDAIHSVRLAMLSYEYALNYWKRNIHKQLKGKLVWMPSADARKLQLKPTKKVVVGRWLLANGMNPVKDMQLYQARAGYDLGALYRSEWYRARFVAEADEVTAVNCQPAV